MLEIQKILMKNTAELIINFGKIFPNHGSEDFIMPILLTANTNYEQ